MSTASASDNGHRQDTAGSRTPARAEAMGIAGKTARAFIRSPLTPLLLAAFFLIGFLGLMVTPREEDPQISVPMVDIMVANPGASANEVANLISEPLERLMSELSGVKHVYSMSHDGFSMVTVQFEVGEQLEPSLVKLYDKLQSNMDRIPKGVMPPLVKPKTIDDVPLVTVTMSSGQLDLVQLRKLGLDVEQRFKALPDTGLSFVTGGSRDQVRVEVDPSRLTSYHLTMSMIAQSIMAANQRSPSGNVIDGSRWFDVYSGAFLENAAEIGNLVVAVTGNRPVFLRDIATISQGASETKSIVESSLRGADGKFTTQSAVTVAVAKKHGTNGVDVADALLSELQAMKSTLIPPSVEVTVTRNYGATASDKVSHLIMKLFIVSALVTVLALVTMGMRPAVIVLITIPAVLLMSLAVAYVLDFTINRVSMFALVFAIGILVDDAIVVVENIYRRWLQDGSTADEITESAVDEVGNPTILATFTVVAALLPMGFVSGMMGPYMLPIPVLSSAAMVFSLFAAFVFVPWLAAKVKPSMAVLQRAADSEHRQSAFIAKYYSKLISPIINSRLVGNLTLFAIILMMLGAVALFPLKSVAFKMLPFDNNSELQVVIDLPEGTDIFATENLAKRIGARLEGIPEITAFQTYSGTSSPFNFNGLVRHYFLRGKPWQGDIAIQLLDKSERARSSHEIATEIRAMLAPVAQEAGARLTIAEAPPGPPVLAPVVAEVYGPTAEIRRDVAGNIATILKATPDVADVNTFMEAPHDRLEFVVDRLKAAMFGVSVEDINREIAMAAGGFEAGPLRSANSLEQSVIVVQVPIASRVNMGNILMLPVPTRSGTTVPLGELGRMIKTQVNPPIYHKDLRALEYVMADVVGPLGAPLYGMLAVDNALADHVTPDGQTISGHYFSRPEYSDVSGFKWDGEWEVTYVTFRDMGIAFMAALVLIYFLVVAEFRSFILPAVVMAPIPLTLIGIIPGHWLLGADFTATSMIGFIALAGIIVRNSILLVEFARAEVQNGMDVQRSITLAAEVRLRPILITALALVIGSMVLLSDPIFRGMAVSLLFGSLVATFLTLVVIPLGCISVRHRFPNVTAPNPPQGPAPANGGPDGNSPLDDGGAQPPRRPERLQRRQESGDVSEAPMAATDPAAPAGRPQPLVRKSPALPSEPASPSPGVSARPARIERKSEVNAADETATAAVPSAETQTALPARPAKLLRKPAAQREDAETAGVTLDVADAAAAEASAVATAKPKRPRAKTKLKKTAGRRKRTTRRRTVRETES